MCENTSSAVLEEAVVLAAKAADFRDASDSSTKDAKGRRINEDDESSEANIATTEVCKIGDRPIASTIAAHYNELEEAGLEKRSRSRIVYMRNFHNWVKSMLIAEYLDKAKEQRGMRGGVLAVADFCCGKGGDLHKWRKGNITHLICSDIAAVSLEQCKERYKVLQERNPRLFTAEFIMADCTRVRLREKYRDSSLKLDLVSCQFALHYAFESQAQVECMLKNASECLRPGGYFIGTIPNSNCIVARARGSSNGFSFGNNIYHVRFDENEFMDESTGQPHLFGAKYHFQLDGVVNCPEFLVYFPLLEYLAKKYGLKLLRKQSFNDFFEENRQNGHQLLTTMKALEKYPPIEGTEPMGDADDDYTHIEHLTDQTTQDKQIGTLSKSEWEASTIYMLFVFEKVKNTWNADGTPCFIFT